MLFTLQTVCADHHWGWGPGPSGEAVLAERYARGEIDATEYRDRLGVLRERRR